MKNKYLILLFVAVFSAFLAYPANASAAAYKTGTLIKSEKNPIIYYIASDNRRYRFPNAATYKSWYKDFSNVEVVSAGQLRKIKASPTYVTARPGAQLVKFSNNPKIYVVTPGAVLRWVEDKETAAMYYGKDWKKKIITLSPNQLDNYVFGENLNRNSKFSKTKAVLGGSSIDSELKNRDKTKLSSKKINLSSSAVNQPTLKSLGENLQSSLKPSFNSSVNLYSITAKYEESILTLRPTAHVKEATIYVNETKINNGSTIKLKLKIGTNDFVVKVVTPDGQSLKYSLTVVREKANDNPFLKSLNENLKATICPKFSPTVYKYEIDAAYNEAVLKLKPKAENSKATIKVNNEDISAGGTYSVLLNYGKNEINIRVRAQNGSSKTYKLVVNRHKYPKADALDLISLKTNLDYGLSPAFRPNMTLYYSRANANEDRVVITAKPKHKSANVFIDGQKTNSKVVSLTEGRNEYYVVVQVDGGFERKYKLTIDKSAF